MDSLLRFVNDGVQLTVDNAKKFPLSAKGSDFRFAERSTHTRNRFPTMCRYPTIDLHWSKCCNKCGPVHPWTYYY